MCAPGCQKKLIQRLNRRDFIKSAAALTGFSLTGCMSLTSMTRVPAAIADVGETRFSRVVDLTHTLGTDFPTFDDSSNLMMETVATFDPDGYNMKRWLLVEHTGTHMDAPIHFSTDQDTADMIPIANLVLPLVVVDIRAKAAENPNAQLTLDDLKAWERQHGPIPDRACVAMYSGWEEKLHTEAFRNIDPEGVLHFPGFHLEAVEFLLEERNVPGIAVDTLSLDSGLEEDVPVHYRWLPSNRWGLENVANLGQVPPVGATIVVGGPKIAGATGGPSRVMALV